MTTLNQLIHKIEYPLKVSREDVLDDIQQYWDEAANTVSSYWKDTDAEVAEELGVTPVAVAQLLDDNRPGYAYANIGGNSGVASYDYGADWMVVNFTTGSRYIYTLKSTTPESMGYLKKYAQEGKGLNSYIMRMLREDYAGKNVKGVILIKPGMERYYQQANKRLQLLYAYRNTGMETVSSEGIGDMIASIGRFFTGKDEHGVRKEDKKPGASVKDHTKWYTPEGQKEWKRLEDTMKRFYMNPNWIDNQTLVTGKVKAEDISKALVFNGTLGNDPLGNVTKGIQYRDKFAQVWYPPVKQLADQANAIFKRLAKETAGASEDDTAAVGKVEKGIEELEALPEPLDRLPKPSGSGLGNLIPVVKTQKELRYLSVATEKEPVGEATLPALNKEQIKTACELILKLLDWEPAMKYISWPDFGDGSKFSDWIYEADNNVYMQLYERFSQQGCDQIYCDPVRHLINTRQVAAALEQWIDRSIQSKVSKEAYPSNRETKMSKTVKQYEKQITDAGSDGLDPVARQFMAIGLESIVNDSAIVYTPVGDVVSVEGIWQSIKDFFANRPTKIHLVGKDPDLRNKLRRTIGDPTWLSRQKYTLGQVNYRALPDFTPQTAQSYVQRYKAAVNSVSQHNSREMLKIKDALKIAVNALSMYSNGMQTSTAPLDLAIARINPYMIRLNINLKEPELMDTELVPQTGDALTKVEVRMFSDLIGTVHGVQTAYEDSLRVSMALPNVTYVKSLYAPRPSTPHSVHGPAIPNPDHAPILAAIKRLETAYATITYMVNAEIKQRITTHAAWINAENIADSLVNYIGKSITNVTTNSFEAFNEPVIPTTQDLKAACETYLVASNEGIFDTLKKLFTGSKKAEIVGELPVASIDVAAKFTNGPDAPLPAVTMTGSKTAIFLDNGKYNPNWIADLQRDVLAYDKIIKDLSAYDAKLEAWEMKWASKLDAFNGDANREDEFVALLKQVQASEPKPYYDVFSNSHDFVMWGKDGWDDGEEGFSQDASRPGSATIEIDEVPTGKVGALKKLITNTANLIRIAEDGHYEMYGHGPDFTDAPYRGYSNSDKAVDVMNKFRMHAHVSNDPLDCLHQVTVRLELILDDLANYITLVNKHRA